MSVETIKNRDLFIKICFMYFLNHILKILGIDEEIDDIQPIEYITMDKKEGFKILDSLLDFVVLAKSGKIIIFEFKKNMLRKSDLKQVYNYYRQIYCKEKKDTIAIIIVISKEGKIMEYDELDVTYHPRIIKTKSINKQKDLKAIRDKFKNNLKLTSEECSLIVAFPIFELKESECEIVDEMCRMIKYKKHCIPKNELDGLIIGMYLNIVEYIDVDKQQELMEMIEMAERSEGVIAKFKRECREEAFKKGEEKTEKRIVRHLFKKIPNVDIVAVLLDMNENDIQNMLKD